MIRAKTIFYPNFSASHKSIFTVGLMMMFIAIFDGILAYSLPVKLTQLGLSTTSMGLILGSSSLFGAVFDFLLSKYIKKPIYRRFYLLMYIACLIYLATFYLANNIFLYILVMASWALFYDLMNFAHYDFVSKETKKNEHSLGFGVIDLFKCIGFSISPLLAGMLIEQIFTPIPYLTALIFLILSSVFFVVLILSTARKNVDQDNYHENLSLFKEIKLWRKVGKILWPVLILTLLINVIDSFFWVIGPLLSEQLKDLHPFGGLLLTLYFIPSVFVGWYLQKITNRFGKKRSAFVALIVGGVVLLTLPISNLYYVILIQIFLFSLTTAVAWPASKAAFADYISESPKVEKEIQGIADFSTNSGYIIGPVVAGIVAGLTGYKEAFSLLGFIIIIVASLLLYFSPKKLNVPNNYN